ncbi:hypothetical protein XENORESO_011856, partial [Xenotaenia resolanae]
SYTAGSSETVCRRKRSVCMSAVFIPAPECGSLLAPSVPGGAMSVPSFRLLLQEKAAEPSDSLDVLQQEEKTKTAIIPFTSVSADNQCRTSAKADIVLLVDGSWSIGRINFKTIRNFIARMVGVFDIGPNNVQIALAQYSGDPRTEWHLNTHSTRDSLLKAINDLPYKGGNTMTGMALRYILQENFQPAVGLRSDSRKIGVLITDGKSQDEIINKSQSLRDSGIELYAIGVKNADENELRSIASDPDEIHMYNVADFKFLLDIVDDLSGNLCNSVKGSGRSGQNKAAPPD